MHALGGHALPVQALHRRVQSALNMAMLWPWRFASRLSHLPALVLPSGPCAPISNPWCLRAGSVGPGAGSVGPDGAVLFLPSHLHHRVHCVQAALGQVAPFFSFPVTTIIVSIAIAITPPLQALFFNPVTDDAAQTASGSSKPPLDVITQSLDKLGAAMIPTLMVGLGASLARGPGAAHVPWRVLVALVVIRLVLLPILGTAIVLGTKALGTPPMRTYYM